MNRQQLQAKIKELKLQGLVNKKFDARQSNKILAEKIAEVTNDEADRDELASSLQNVKRDGEFLPIESQETIRKVVEWSYAGTAKDKSLIVNALWTIGNKKASERTEAESYMASDFIQRAIRYANRTA